MMTSLTHRTLIVMALLAFTAAGPLAADDALWTGASDNVWLAGDGTNWTDGDGTYNDGDDVTFDDSGLNTNPISISGTVNPGSILFDNSAVSYELRNGTIGGSTGLVKNGSGDLTIVIAGPEVVDSFSGDVFINDGILRTLDASASDANRDHGLGSGTIHLDGDARLTNQARTGFGPALGITLPNNLVVGSGGGELETAYDGNLRSGFTHSGVLTLNGDLTYFAPEPDDFRFSEIQLGNDAEFTADIGDGGGTVVIEKITSSSTQDLTLSEQTNPANFDIEITSTSQINVANLNVNAQLTVKTSDLSLDPFQQIQDNGGVVTMGVGARLSLGGNKDNALIIDPTAITWQGDGTLNLNTESRVNNGNKDRDWDIVGDLEVSAASGLTQINYAPRRGTLTITGGNTLTIGDGGVLDVDHVGTQLNETVNGDITVLDGGVIDGFNNAVSTGGGLNSSGGTMTLGDGTEGTVTIRGEHGTSDTVFNIGYGNNLNVTSNTTVRYSSTTSDPSHFFNIAWTGNGRPDNFPAPLQFNAAHGEGSAGTEFDPQGATIAIVGPATGDVANLTQDVTLLSDGTVGFYADGGSGTRGALGTITLDGNTIHFGEFGVFEVGGLNLLNLPRITLADHLDAPQPLLDGTVLFRVAGTDPSLVTGEFASRLGTQTYYTVGLGGDGNDIVIHIPEPASAAMLATLTLIGLRRGRHSS